MQLVQIISFITKIRKNNMEYNYIIEVRDSEGKLDFESERIKQKEHPFLFSKSIIRLKLFTEND